jgi:hypothetical protein
VLKRSPATAFTGVDFAIKASKPVFNGLWQVFQPRRADKDARKPAHTKNSGT